MLPFQYVSLKLGLPTKRLFPRLFHKVAAFGLGLRITQIGQMATDRPLLITSNHSSWTDIVVLGSSAELSFVAKSDVAGWPVFGTLARLQRTVFVERTKRSSTGKTTNEVSSRMADGDAVVLFAEGTSSNGNEVLPFKSALVGAAQQAQRDTGGDVYVQPVSIAYTRFHGMPMGRQFRSMASWYGKMPIGPHIKDILSEGAIDVSIEWGEPIVVSGDTNRKALTTALEQRVRGMNQKALLDLNHQAVPPQDTQEIAS